MNFSWVSSGAAAAAGALHPLPLSHFSFHQEADGAVILGLAADSLAPAPAALAALAPLFGPQPVAGAILPAEDKVPQFTSDLAGAHS
jgi:phenylacetate-CoA ligase